jgi:arginyl-tRNA synthetase
LIETGKIQKEVYDIENNYPLESMQEFISLKTFLEHCQDKGSNIEELSLEFFGEIAKKIFLETQKELLSNIHVVFDRWYSEKSNLHQKDLVSKTCQLLDQNGATYLQDGALWFKAKEYGDERDRVLKKADGNYTYLAADFAYHLDKLSRGHDLLINLWGADHHGQIPGMKGGLKALGMDSERLEIILVQLVSLTKDGQEVKMSKRKGDIVLVRDLVDEVGVDAFRYFLVESQANNRMVFDLELASKQDKDNPVYYIQYAHARCSSILRNICNSRIDQENGKEIPALLTEDELLKWIKTFKSDHKLFSRAFKACTADELASSKALILSLVNFPEEIKDSALIYSPYKIANYLKNIAGLFHQFYSHNRVICDDIDLMKARLAIVLACKITIANALKILAISAPEKM